MGLDFMLYQCRVAMIILMLVNEVLILPACTSVARHAMHWGDGLEHLEGMVKFWHSEAQEWCPPQPIRLVQRFRCFLLFLQGSPIAAVVIFI